MPLPIAQTVLVAGRGESACRVLRSAGAHGLRTVAVHAADAPDDPHLELADHVTGLPGAGPTAHLEQRAVLDAAVAYGARLLHPADPRLAEDPDFAAACAARGVVLAGPGEAVLRRLGDKVLARDAARAAGVRTLPGTAAPTSADQVRRFLGRHPDGIVLKPVRGWGGHGVLTVQHESDVDDAFATATAAALATSGDPALYAERLAEWARQVEVQVVGAPHGGGVRVLALGDRDASVQRGRRPLVDVAPAPQLRDGVRRALHAAAARFAASIGLCGVASVELLLADDEFVFLEANPRLVLGDAVTEAVTGVDLVVTQLEIARHADFADLELPDGVVVDSAVDDGVGVSVEDAAATSGVPHRPAGIAIEAHVMSERVRPDGSAVPTLGTVGRLEPPTGAGVRVDSRCLVTDGVVVGEDDDTLLATVVTAVRGDDLPGTAARCAQVLDDLVLDGPPTTVPLLLALLRDRELGEGTVGLDYLDRRLPDLLAAAAAHEPRPVPPPPAPTAEDVARTHRADLADRSGAPDGVEAPAGAAGEVEHVLGADRSGLAIELAPPGTRVGAGEPVALVADRDGRQHLVCAPVALVVGRPLTGRGASLEVGDPVLAYVEAAPAAPEVAAPERDDLEEVRRRHAGVLDAARGRHVASRRAAGRRTVRELVDTLVDAGSFVEFGPLVVGEAATTSEPADAPRRPVLADGLVCGVATVNGALVDAADPRVVLLAHDPTAAPDDGSGARAQAKAERVLALAAQHRLPVVLMPEGGGAHDLGAGTLAALARLRGRVPVVGVATGSSFGARAALLGLCDVVVATPDAVMGLGDPALVEAAGLGRFEEPDVGPVRTHRRTGVVHLLAADDAEAVGAARDVLSRFQGRLLATPAPRDGGEVLRGLVPADRLAGFDVRAVVGALADAGSVLELAPEHAPGLVTALVRVDGRTLGVVANSGDHLDGALDAEAIGKLGGFWRTCDAHRLPVLALVDTPGLVVGPDAERDGGLRALGRLLSEGARLSVPYGVVVLRRAYGLAASAMAGGPANASTFTVAWPTAELGAVRLDHAVRLEHGHELDAEPDPEAREALLDKLVAEAHARGAALAAAAAFDVDDVVDPAETRRWVRMLLRPRPS